MPGPPLMAPARGGTRPTAAAHGTGARRDPAYFTGSAAAGSCTPRDPAYLTNRFSSSAQFWMTTICGSAAAVPAPPSLIIRNRWPSGEMS